MPLEARMQSTHGDQPVTFEFSDHITRYVVGISYFDFTFLDRDHKILDVSVKLNVNQPAANQLHVNPQTVMADSSGHSTQAIVFVSALAWTGAAAGPVALASQYGIENGEVQERGIPINTPSPVVNQSFLSGFEASYGEGDNHEVHKVDFGTGLNLVGSEDFIQGTSEMSDSSGNSAESATVDGGVVATATKDLLVIVPKSHTQFGEGPVQLPAGVKDVAVFLTDFKAQFPGDDDHLVQTILGGGTIDIDAWKSKRELILTDAFATIAGGDYWQDNQRSYVSLAIVGVLD